MDRFPYKEADRIYNQKNKYLFGIGKEVIKMGQGQKRKPFRPWVPRRKFKLGVIAWTLGVNDLMKGRVSFTKFVLKSLKRHAVGDWGDISEQDQRENEYAIGKYLRLFSAYGSGYKTIWIITEADRSITTILLPYEY